ncbi:hypothetical protein BDW72DRAFT_170540 [Aspergillus terricola var. indicus]
MAAASAAHGPLQCYIKPTPNCTTSTTAINRSGRQLRINSSKSDLFQRGIERS